MELKTGLSLFILSSCYFSFDHCWRLAQSRVAVVRFEENYANLENKKTSWLKIRAVSIS